MNLANELDLAMDEAVKRELGRIYDAFFQSLSPTETKLSQLTTDVKKLESNMEQAIKALEDI